MEGFARDQFDRNLNELRAAIITKADLAGAKRDVVKWMSVAYGLQTLAILGGVAALFRLFGHS
jgi:hypothetical protein